MIDGTLIQQLVVAIQSRELIQQLPPGLREHAQQWEKMIISDIEAQLSDNTQVAPLINDVERSVLQNFIIPFLQKHVTTATIAWAVYLVAQYLQK